jgi:magnesium-transporting ATPase (P-type)
MFVLAVTLAKEAVDDLHRWRRDREANGQRYQRLRRRVPRDGLAPGAEHRDSFLETIPSSSIRVGDILILHSNQRVPADMLLLRTHDRNLGSIFIRTDQLVSARQRLHVCSHLFADDLAHLCLLRCAPMVGEQDGETDWKLRNAVRMTQALQTEGELLDVQARVGVEAPRKEIYEFAANFSMLPAAAGAADPASLESAASSPISEPLSLDHTLWANTVVASGTVAALVIYTGTETRAALNANQPTSKIGALEVELNRLSKLLFGLTVALAFVMVALKGLHGRWLLYLFRFILLFSSIIPISMRVNLDLSKTLYARLVERDPNIPGTLVRNSTIPEELGRVRYVFMDKTGTLTRNIMHFKCVQLQPPLFFTKSTLGKLAAILRSSFIAEREERRSQSQGGTLDGSTGVLVSESPRRNQANSLAPLSIPTSPVFDSASSVQAPASPSRSGRTQRRKGSRPTTPGSALLLDVALDPAPSSAAPPGSTSKLQRMSTRLQLEAEEAEEDSNAAMGVGGLLNTSTGGAEDESETDATEHRLIGSDSSSTSHAQRVKLAAALTRHSARAQNRKKGGYSNLEHKEELEDAEEGDIEMSRLASVSASVVELEAASNNATGRRSSALSFDDEDGDGATTRYVISPASSPDDFGSSIAADETSSARVQSMVRALVTSLALCHNVTPVVDEVTGEVVYQASSPDEVALVKFTASVGLALKERTQTSITVQTPLADFDAAHGHPSVSSLAFALHQESYDILHIFPFTSESRRMGIIMVRSRSTGRVTFYLKGAESVMASKITASDWLEEEVDNLARVGLRTLVIASKDLSEAEYNEFARRLMHAQSMLADRDSHVQSFLHSFEKNMTLLGLTGVEDKLQEAVKPTLETLRNAGISLWMLTGGQFVCIYLRW